MVPRLRRIVPWFVVATKSRREGWAAENVERQGAEVYLPRISSVEVLFPSYLFVRTTNGTWRFLQGTYGVSSVIMVGEHPAALTPTAIEEIRALEDDDGFVLLPDWVGGRRSLRPGESVEVVEGPFMGAVGLYQGQRPNERASALLNMLGRQTSVELELVQLERYEPKGRRRGN